MLNIVTEHLVWLALAKDLLGVAKITLNDIQLVGTLLSNSLTHLPHINIALNCTF